MANTKSFRPQRCPATYVFAGEPVVSAAVLLKQLTGYIQILVCSLNGADIVARLSFNARNAMPLLAEAPLDSIPLLSLRHCDLEPSGAVFQFSRFPENWNLESSAARFKIAVAIFWACLGSRKAHSEPSNGYPFGATLK